MITSVVSSAARLAIAPAKLTGRVAGYLLRELRGHGDGDAAPAASSARAKPPARTSSKARRKRDGAVARTKAQPKRPTTRTRTGARTKPEPKPLDDVTIARKVESTIFRDVDVDKGKVDVNVAERVVWLRGEVASQALIRELEARATDVTEVRRVENLLHVPEVPAPGRTETPAVAAQSSDEPSPPVAEVDGDADGDESPEQDPGVVGVGRDSAYQASGTGQRGPEGG